MKKQRNQMLVLLAVLLVLTGLYFLFTKVMEFPEEEEKVVTEYTLGSTDYLPAEETEDVSSEE